MTTITDGKTDGLTDNARVAFVAKNYSYGYEMKIGCGNEHY